MVLQGDLHMIAKLTDQLQKQPLVILIMFLISLIGGIITIVLGWDDFYKNYLSFQVPIPVWLILLLPFFIVLFFVILPTNKKDLKTKELVTIEGQTFRVQQIILDGKRFVNCTFDGCELIYKGEDGFSLEKNTFDKLPRIQFIDYAGNTLNTLKMLNDDPDFKIIIKETFK